MFSEDFKKSNYQTLSLKDGEKTVGVFAGEPLEFMNNYTLKEEFPMGLPNYPKGTSKRFRINFLTKTLDGKKFIPFIFAGGPKVAIQIEKLIAKTGKDFLYEISVEGSGTKKVTTIMQERSLTDDEIKLVKSTELLPLKVFEKEVAPV